MSASRCYLDFNASAPLCPEAREACVAALDLVGNASSIHAEGRAVRQVVETARTEVARLCGRAVDRIGFSSGGTEAAATLLRPHLTSPSLAGGAGRLLVSATEHACVLQGHGFPSEAVTVLPVGPEGVIDLDALDAALAEGAPALVAVQAANNETGVLQPIEAIAVRVHAAGGLLVCDSVQAAGRLDVAELCDAADAVFVSGHKIGAPKGIGAIGLADGVRLASPFIRGGGQERGLRSGTENVQGIAGFGAAAKVAQVVATSGLVRLQERLEDGLRRLDETVAIFGADAPRLPNTTCFAVSGLMAQTALMSLDLAGVAVSSGAACSSGKVTQSHVLHAMGVLHDLARGALRVSWGPTSTEDDIDRFLEAFGAVMRRVHRRLLPAAA